MCLWSVSVFVIGLGKKDLERMGLWGTERQNQPLEQEIRSDRTRKPREAMTHDGHWEATRACFLFFPKMLSILIKQCRSAEAVGLQIHQVFPVIQIQYDRKLHKQRKEEKLRTILSSLYNIVLVHTVRPSWQVHLGNLCVSSHRYISTIAMACLLNDAQVPKLFDWTFQIKSRHSSF